MLTDYEKIIIDTLRELMKEQKGHIRIDWNEGKLDYEKLEKKNLIEQTRLTN